MVRLADGGRDAFSHTFFPVFSAWCGVDSCAGNWARFSNDVSLRRSYRPHRRALPHEQWRDGISGNADRYHWWTDHGKRRFARSRRIDFEDVEGSRIRECAYRRVQIAFGLAARRDDWRGD